MDKSIKKFDFVFLCAFPSKFGINHEMAREIEALYAAKIITEEERINKLELICMKYNLELDDLTELKQLLDLKQ